MKAKELQRRLCKSKLLKIDKNVKKIWDLAIFSQISKYIIKNKISSIGIYWSIKNEVDTIKIIEFCFVNNIKVFLPKTIDDQMMFYEHYDNIKLIYNNKLEIYEPIISEPKLNIEKCIMIIPMVGYDKYLNRLGNGYGFYDRYLLNNNVFKLGIAYKIQEINKINTDLHDVKMDLIINN